MLAAQKDHYERQLTLLLADKSGSIAKLKVQYKQELEGAVQQQVQAQLTFAGADPTGGVAMQVSSTHKVPSMRKSYSTWSRRSPGGRLRRRTGRIKK